MKNAIYESNLTDAQWEYLQPMLPPPAKRGRPRTDLRRVIDAILYVVKGGIPWRYLPAGFPPWKTVYHVFRRWTLTHQWAALNDALRILTRKAQGKRTRPTAAVLDSQSVKSAGHGGEVGYDAGKRIKGRKRHLLVDTLGLILGVAVTPAHTTERDGAQAVLVMPERRLPTGSKHFAPNWTFKWSNARTASADLKSCRTAGSWSARSAGCSIIVDWCATMKGRRPVQKLGSIFP